MNDEYMVRLVSLDLKVGDTVLGPKGQDSFVVLDSWGRDLVILWLETGEKRQVWVHDLIRGPVEVLKRA